jgi:hypothetical protein
MSAAHARLARAQAPMLANAVEPEMNAASELVAAAAEFVLVAT